MKKIELLNKFQLSVGNGEDHFPMSRGSFKYQEKLHWKDTMEIIQTKEENGDCFFTLRSKKRGIPGRLSICKKAHGYQISFEVSDSLVNRFWLTFPTDSKEHIYGCGETFSEFDLKGQNVRIWVAEHQNTNRISKKIISEKLIGKHPERKKAFSKYESYYVQPTFVSSEHYYVHVDGSCYMEFDFRKSDATTLYMRKACPIEIGYGDTFTDVSYYLSESIGRQRELPDWLYDGVVLGIQEGCEVVDKKLQSAFAHNIPVSAVWCQDWSGCRRTGFGYQVMWNWVYDDSLYPKLQENIKRWKEQGVRFLGYINPFLAIEKEIYAYAKEHGYCVKDKKGEDYLVTITTFPAAMVDFTNPKAYSWYKSLIKENMIGIGMSGWMADFGEYLPPDCVLYSGANPKLIHNEWPAIWARMNREAIEECGMKDEVFFFTRAGYTGSVKDSAMMWNGDQHVDWSVDDGLPSVIPATLSLAMSGYGITHSDAGGYTTIMHMRRTKELLMRWEEMNAFSPLLRTHEGNQPVNNVQFDYDEELLNHLSRFAEIHVSLKPYLVDAVEQQITKGTPVMRPIFYHYEEEKAFTECTEYLLGRDLLVAPILEEGARERMVYLPDDRWIHVFTGKDYEGGNYLIDSPMGMPPVFVRKESQWLEKLTSITIKHNN